MEARDHPLIPPAIGTARQITSFHYGQHRGQKTYIQSSIHAGETPGMLVACVLRRKLAALEAAGRIHGEIVVVPVPNPIGLNQHVLLQMLGSYDLNTGQNFNRNFYDLAGPVRSNIESRLSGDSNANRAAIRAAIREVLEAQRTATELESQRLALQWLSFDADVVFDLHCDWESEMYVFTNKDVWPDVEPLARYLNAGTALLTLDSGGNMFGEIHSFCWSSIRERFGERFPIPNGSISVTVELRGLSDVSYDYAEKDAQAIIEYLTHRGVIEGTAAPLPPLKLTLSHKADVERLIAPSSGVLVFRAECGEWVEAGTPIADIIDPLTDQVTTLKCVRSGRLFSRNKARFAIAGMLVANIAPAM